MGEPAAAAAGASFGSEPMRQAVPQSLTSFAGCVLQAIGTPEDIAAQVARHLVGANLAGHDSHGVLRLSWYVEAAERGRIDVAARPELVRAQGACALFDAHRGFGHHSTSVALEWALAQAPQHGIASVAVRHSTHIGRLGEYTERAVGAGYLAMVTVGNAGPRSRLTPPFGGREPALGTNPWALGAPGLSHVYLYDGATTTVAEGKVRAAQAKGVEVPPGCITDRDGRPTTRPDDFYAGGAMVPLGEQVAGHKGFGLGLGSALFGALSLAADAADVPADGSIDGVWLLVLDPAAFGEADRYRAIVEANLVAVKAVPAAAGSTGVLLPGEPEQASRRERSAGMLLPDATWEDLRRLAERFEIEPPVEASSASG
jgi:LDH2 family malate/lactate/ureidoglycolate dehydrogenase